MADSIRRWQERYAAGDFDDAGVEVQIDAGWVDWACDDGALAGKTKRLAAIITRLKDGGRLELDSMTVSLRSGGTDAGQYDSVVFGGGSAAVSVNLDDPRYDDKWVVFENGEVVFSCAIVTQLAKWLNTAEVQRSIGKFDITPGFTSDGLRAAATADALDKFGVEIEFDGIQRKYFRDGGQAGIWLDGQLPTAPRGTILVVIYGTEAVAGYAIDA